MKLLVELEQAWRGVELAAKDGHLKNQTMLAFAWRKELQKLRPDLHVTYESRADSMPEHQPNVIIWQDAGTHSVLFAGELKFVVDAFPGVNSAIAKLRHLEQAPSVAVPMRDTKSGTITRHRTAKSKDFVFGLFIVADRDTAATVWAEVVRNFRESGRAGSHFAFGAISTDPSMECSFQSMPGEERGD